MAEWQYGSTAAWQYSRMAEWQYGRMAVWQYGSITEWQNGSMAVYGTMDLRMNGVFIMKNMSSVSGTNLFHPCDLKCSHMH